MVSFFSITPSVFSWEQPSKAIRRPEAHPFSKSPGYLYAILCTSTKYFETEVVHCVFDALSVTEVYSWNTCSSNRLSCMLRHQCLLRAVQCAVHSGNNDLFLLMTLCAFLILQTHSGPLWVPACWRGDGMVAGDRQLALSCAGHSPLGLAALSSLVWLCFQKVPTDRAHEFSCLF